MLQTKARPLNLPIKHPFGISRWTKTVSENVLVTIHSDGNSEDKQGIGEAAPNARYRETPTMVLDYVAQWDRAHRDMQIDSEQSFAALLDELHADTAAPLSARSALDMALHDWWLKSRELCLLQYWGHSSEIGPMTSFTIGLDTPATMASKVSEGAAFQILKIKLGSDNDAEVINAIRQVTQKPLWVDANEGWQSPEVALRHIEWLATQGVTLIEQPLPANQLDRVARLKKQSPLPIFADEDCFSQVDMRALADAYHGVNLKLDKCGGLWPARQLLAQARQHGLQVMIGCMVASSVALTAAAHLALHADWADLDGHLLLSADPFVGLTIEAGRVVVPAGLGLGVRARL